MKMKDKPFSQKDESKLLAGGVDPTTGNRAVDSSWSPSRMFNLWCHHDICPNTVFLDNVTVHRSIFFCFSRLLVVRSRRKEHEWRCWDVSCSSPNTGRLVCCFALSWPAHLSSLLLGFRLQPLSLRCSWSCCEAAELPRWGLDVALRRRPPEQDHDVSRSKYNCLIGPFGKMSGVLTKSEEQSGCTIWMFTAFFLCNMLFYVYVAQNSALV